MLYFGLFFLGLIFGMVLTSLVSVERSKEAYQEGVKFGKKYAEDIARIDRMAEEDEQTNSTE